MFTPLHGRSVIVTGGSKGSGKGDASDKATQSVIRSMEKVVKSAEEQAAMPKGLVGTIMTLVADVKSIEKRVAALEKRQGR